MSPRTAWLAALFAPTVAVSQATPNVSVLDPAYRHVDVLASVGMADAVMVGQRPYSRREIARVVAAARGTAARWEARVADSRTSGGARRRLAARLAAGRAALAALAPEFGEEADAAESHAAPPPRPRGRALDLVTADLTVTNGVQRAAPGTPLGTSDAAVVGLAEYREGRPITRGATAFVETQHWGAARWVAASARLRFRAAGADDADAAARYTRAQALSVHNVHARVVAGPWALTAGRDHLVWGQGARGGPLLSANAPALDLVTLSTDVPIRVPLVWRVLGPMKGTAFFADLGPRQNYRGANLTGYKLNARPLRGFELGVGTINQWGGRGAPAASAAKRLLDQLLIVDSFTGVEDFQFSNKLAGVDARLTLPALGGLAAYYEVQFDDFDHTRLRGLFTEDAAQVVGARAAALGADGRWELGVEGRRTGLRYYQHTDFTSGVTYERFFLGDALGPQGRGAYLRGGRRDARDGGLWLELAAERRRNDQYVSVEDPDFRFELVARRPAEARVRAVVTWEARAPAARRAETPALLVQLGAERVTNFRFAGGAGRTNLLARAGVELRPR